jgi:nitrogen regulatory protein P-II 1
VKLITAVLSPATFEAVRDALAIFGVRGLTVCNVYAAPARIPNRVQVYRGQRMAADLDPMVRVDLVIPDDETADVVHVLIRAAGEEDVTERVWLTPVDLVVRIRTGEYGVDAV